MIFQDVEESSLFLDKTLVFLSKRCYHKLSVIGRGQKNENKTKNKEDSQVDNIFG